MARLWWTLDPSKYYLKQTSTGGRNEIFFTVIDQNSILLWKLVLLFIICILNHVVFMLNVIQKYQVLLLLTCILEIKDVSITGEDKSITANNGAEHKIAKATIQMLSNTFERLTFQ